MEKMKKGYLEIIMGCMASGKSTEVVRKYRRYLQTYTASQIALISHSTDTRYGDQVIATHDQTKIPCLCVSCLNDIMEDKNKKISDWEVIIIEEAQFFPDLKIFVKNAVDKYHKKVIVVGLDGDFERKPFGDILELIPMADEYRKMKAICYYCKDETEAIFTKRVTDSNQQKLVGTLNEYKPVCRYHFLH
jgi:thymidine kinase